MTIDEARVCMTYRLPLIPGERLVEKGIAVADKTYYISAIHCYYKSIDKKFEYSIEISHNDRAVYTVSTNDMQFFETQKGFVENKLKACKKKELTELLLECYEEQGGKRAFNKYISELLISKNKD